MNRRSLFAALPMLAFSGSSAITSAEDTSRAPVPQAPAAKGCKEPLLNECRAFPFETLPIRYSGAGAPTRQILEGRVPGAPDPAGEIIELHETSLAPGKMPHPAHKHPHAELLLVRQGTIEFQSDGPPVRVTAGGAAYCAPDKLHGFRNVGEGEAMYFVVKIGSAPVCQT